MSSPTEIVAIATAAMHAGSAAAAAGMDIKNTAPKKSVRPDRASPGKKKSRGGGRG